MNGLLLLDKPVGPTSMEVLEEVKGALKIKRAGHTGTLDPIASGLLPICCGKATKFSQFLLGAEKSYAAELTLGIETDTCDAEGQIVEENPLPEELSREMVEGVLRKFRGEIEQTPPLFSAVKVRGKRAYQLARKGKKVELKARKVSIFELKLVRYSPPKLEIFCRVSKGTYIRSLIRDIGRELGCGAYMTALRRLEVDRYRVEDAISLDDLRENPVLRAPYFIPIDRLFEHWPRVILSQRESSLLRHGNVPYSLRERVYFEAPTRFAAYSEGERFLGLLLFDGKGVKILKNL